MGCGESKLAVATSNTILRRKKSSVVGSSKKSKDIETVLENIENGVANGDSTAQDNKSSEQVKEDNVNNVNGGGESVVAHNVNNKDGDDENDKETLDQGNKEEHDDAAGRLITHGSPNRFFSSRKLDEEGIDGIISEGRSGTSDYYTPRHGAGSKGNLYFKADDDILEDNAELALDAETKASEAQNNEKPVRAEENLVKEADVEVATSSSVEAEVSIPAEEEKKQ